MEKVGSLFNLEAINKGFEEMVSQGEEQYHENKAMKEIGSYIDYNKINIGLELGSRQYVMQNYEGKLVDILGSFIQLGYDKNYKDYRHVLIQVLAINVEEVDDIFHMWLRDVAEGKTEVWSQLMDNEAIELYGEVYSYKDDDKKYSIYLESLYNSRIGRFKF